MNSFNRALFSKMSTRVHVFIDDVKQIMDRYAADREDVRQFCTRFKDEKSEFAKRRAIIADEARQQLQAKAAAFAKATREDAESLRQMLQHSLADPINENFLQKARVIKEFGVSPSRTEIHSMVIQAQGNPVAVKILAKLLIDTKSPYRLSYRSAEDYEKDLKTLERLARSAEFYVPTDCHSVGCELYGQVKRKLYRPDGSEYVNGDTWSSVALITNAAEFRSSAEALEKMADSWAADVSFAEAEELSSQEWEEATEAGEEYEEPDTSATIKSTDTDPVMAAAERGRQTAEQNALTDKTVAFYAR